MMKKTYYLHSYGCQMNLADSGVLSAALEAAGYDPVAIRARRGYHPQHLFGAEKAEERALGRLREWPI